MLHFDRAEFSARLELLRDKMYERRLDAMLIFAPESQYWLTGYDTFGFCFFQCLVVTEKKVALLTRSADLRQAQLTSTIEDIRIWKDSETADPTSSLRDMLGDLGLSRGRLGIETDTVGLTARTWIRLEENLRGFGRLTEASDLIPGLRLVKSPAEIAHIRKAAELTDAAFDAAMKVIGPGVNEGAVLAAMTSEIFAAGGDYAGNEFIIGSADHALLCRYQSGRRDLDAQDQLTLEWSGAWRHYHAAAMRTVVVGEPRPEHVSMHKAACDALAACEAALKPGAAIGEVFDAHSQTLDAAGLGAHRLNACGYSMGARFTPCWMDPPMFYEGGSKLIEPNMVFFLHMILMDSDSGAAMTLGRSSLVTETGSEPVSRLSLDLPVA